MRKLPIQSAPVQRSRSARGASQGGVAPSLSIIPIIPFERDVGASFTFAPPFFPFAGNDGVGASWLGEPIIPFASAD